MLYRFLGTHTLCATRQTFQADLFMGGGWLPFHLALCFKSGLLPSMLLFRRWRKPLPKRWQPYVAPLMERCYHQRNGGTGEKQKKPNATETLWREEWPNFVGQGYPVPTRHAWQFCPRTTSACPRDHCKPHAALISFTCNRLCASCRKP